MDASLYPTLKAGINAQTDPTFVGYRQTGQVGAMADWLNGDSTKVVWKTIVTVNAVGDNIVGTELAGLSSLNTQRLQCIVQLSPGGVNPSLTDRRAFFDDVFSGAGGTGTRAKLLALWKRFARQAEALYITGNGTDASPGLLTFEGRVTANDVVQALALP